MDYIYIDESGELAKQSDYFVFGAIITNNPKELDNIIKKEIKGYTTDDYIIKKILKKLNNTDYKVVGIILDKKNIYKIHHSYDYNILYDKIASELAQRININNSTSIIVDKCKNKEEEINNFNKQFTANLNNSKNYSVDIKHTNSIHYNGLQMADIIAWSIFQSVERNNSEFIDLIQNKSIKRVFEE